MNPFDQKAKEWDANLAHTERTQAISEAMRHRVPFSKTMRALEVGAGTGLLSFALKDELGPITLTETSEGMFKVLSDKIAAQGVTTMTPKLIDLTKDALPAESFDLLYLQMVLHHIEEVDAILKTFQALLAPGGYLCIADLEEEDGSFHGHGEIPHHGFRLDTLEDRVARAGFAEAKAEVVYHMRREGHDHLYPVFLLTARKV